MLDPPDAMNSQLYVFMSMELFSRAVTKPDLDPVFYLCCPEEKT